jgi:hypothetical protein
MTPLLLNFRGVSGAQFMANSNLARDLQMAVTALAKNLKNTCKTPVSTGFLKFNFICQTPLLTPNCHIGIA